MVYVAVFWHAQKGKDIRAGMDQSEDKRGFRMGIGQAVLLIVVVVLALAAIAVFLTAPEKVDKKRYPWLIGGSFAHRGLHTADRTIPENSMAAFSNAIRQGYGMEMDVQITKDDRLVVFHDDSLLRMTGVDRKIWDCTYEELTQFTLAGTEEKIPLFTDFLKLVAGQVPLIIEIKNTPDYKKCCALTAAVLRGYRGDFCMESFNPLIVAWFRRHEPQILRGQLSTHFTGRDKAPFYQKLAVEGMLLNFLARPQFVAYGYEHRSNPVFRLCRRLGAITVAWTLRDERDGRRMRKFFDAIIFELFLPPRAQQTERKTRQA